MSIRTSRWPAGVPCWTDLATPDPDAAKAFYGAVLGWDFAATEDEYGGYAVAQVRGAATAAVGPLAEGAVTAWTLYLAADQADDAAALVERHGGTVLQAPGDVGALGRLMIAADPGGAVFGVWQAGTHIGSELVNEPGGLAWEDLRSTDPAAARAFYQGVFGYEMQVLDPAAPDYQLFRLPGEVAPLGGLGPMFGLGPTSHWLVYFRVADTRAAVVTAGERGGRLVGEIEVTPFGTMATLTDPAGAVFKILQAVPGAPEPDRAG
jgi:uncharacterized protein